MNVRALNVWLKPLNLHNHTCVHNVKTGIYAQYITSCWHTHTHTLTQEAMSSPNVINAVKRLTSGYLFKSRHQTHSFFSFYLHRSQKLLSGEKRRFPISSAASAVGPNKARAFSPTLSCPLSSFTDGACRASAALRLDKAAHCQTHNGQWSWRWQWTHCERWCHPHQTPTLSGT